MPAPAITPEHRAIVLAHFDPRGEFDAYVVEALRQYRPHAARLVVVSTSTTRLPAAADRLVDTFLARGNEGYDFASWRAGLATLHPGDYDEILCVNDSVYGPLGDLGPVLRDPRTAAADLWGMVLSEQGTRFRSGRCPHVQSWFLGMRRRLIEAPLYRRFWDSITPLPSKDEIIDRYELGLSAACLRAGLRVAAIYDARDAPPVALAELWPHVRLTSPRRSWRLLRKWRRGGHNPSELLVSRLLAAGIPFVKTSVFRTNHYGLDPDRLIAEIGRRHPEAVPLIRGHLARRG